MLLTSFYVLLPPFVAKSAEPETVRFCFNAWEPYAYPKGEEITGISIDILSEAAKRSGLSAKFVEYPWNRCLQSVQSGDIDAIIDAAERPEFLQGPNSYSAYSNTFWVAPDSRLEIFDFDRIRDLKVGLVNGYKYPNELLEGLSAVNADIDYAIDDQTNIRKLAIGRIDVIVADHVSTKWFSRKNSLRIRPLSPDHSSDYLYASFNKKHPKLQKRIDAAIREMIDEGAVERIYAKYIGNSDRVILEQSN